MLQYLIAFNLLFFLATVISGGFSLSNLLRWGAKFGPLIAHGEWQRLLLCIFLHGNLWHLFFNLYALFQLGRITEGIYGQRKFLIIYLFSGVMGSLFSFFFNFDRIGVGASGAIFGLAGVLLSGGLKYRNTSLSRLGMSILPFVLINLFIGFTVPAIDNAAHVGGLLGGMFLGLVIAPGTPWQRWKKYAEELVYWVFIGVLAFGMVTFFFPAFSPGRASINEIIAFHNQVRDVLQNIEEGSTPSPSAIQNLRPPDSEARKIKELLLALAREEGNSLQLFSEIEERFTSWRETIMKKYQGIITETP
ncbi:MAG: rhomboid family intramembrane serine protease [Candidatus Atribacteria bacterium]|nr:rhomboid family intramembrane serine protease [Candidatus Atribacteria bacterium]